MAPWGLEAFASGPPLHHDSLVLLDHFLRLHTADRLEIFLCASIGLLVLGPFSSMAYYHFVPGAVRRLPLLQWTVLGLVTAAWLLSMSEEFGAAIDRLLPLAGPERARITWAMVFVTFLLFAHLRLLGVRPPEEAPSIRRRTRVVIR
jgi:hypothetical protein